MTAERFFYEVGRQQQMDEEDFPSGTVALESNEYGAPETCGTRSAVSTSGLKRAWAPQSYKDQQVGAPKVYLCMNDHRQQGKEQCHAESFSQEEEYERTEKDRTGIAPGTIPEESDKQATETDEGTDGGTKG